MNWDQIEGKWKQAKGAVKEKWGRLTDGDLDVIAGKRDQLIGKIQERYGITKEEAQTQVESWNLPSATSSEHEQQERERKAS
ncbi:MAG TPA: CsbD family protein [Terriglobales bacterium]|nr:CsbD family protein [Terriglobales bacterium]